ncbi:uncharacterized protein LOC129921113 [Episyrphus balteatus]|uniref:uncharacterized protein LOC129921113 n=1 Tax=Episyrphus balteatus TaxID=286459 RepID=UPI00248652AF|nr:uncharacterized protein LOC129921113 [Episyrphus balteatus]
MDESRPVNTPSDTNSKLPSGKGHTEERQFEKPYRQLIGSLMYLAIATRLDSSFTVNRLAQFNESYQDVHWSAAKRVLRYLRETENYELTYTKDNLGLRGYSDADHANDESDRVSYTGYVFILSGAAITWRSQKQRSVAISSTEAEYVALSETSREATYLLNLMTEMNLPELTKISIGTDNQGAKHIAENSVCHSRTKHIATRYHFVRQVLKDGKVTVIYTPTDMMPADVFTKPLPGPAHYRCMKDIGVIVC